MNGVLIKEQEEDRREEIREMREKAAPQSILRLLRRSSNQIGSFLDRAQKEGSEFLDSLGDGLLEKLDISRIYRMGDKENAIFLTLPTSRKLLGRRFEKPVIVIPIWVGDRKEGFNVFSIVIRSDKADGISISTEWSRQGGTKDWPEDQDDLRDLRHKAAFMLMVISILSQTIDTKVAVA